ncbi:hypothetical protein D3C76_770450 [compost metagenome]
MFQLKKKPARLYHRTEEESPSTIRNLRDLLISILLVSLVVVLQIRYPGPLSVVERLFQWMGLPISSGENGMGWHYANLLLISIIGVLLFYMGRALNRGKIMAFIVIVLLINNGPGWLTTSYQRLFATGVYAVGMDHSQAHCEFDIENSILSGTCHLPLENYSKHTIEIVPVIASSNFRIAVDNLIPDIRLTSVTIPPGVKRFHLAEFNIRLESNRLERNVISSGGANDLKITLSDGVDERKWE